MNSASGRKCHWQAVCRSSKTHPPSILTLTIFQPVNFDLAQIQWGSNTHSEGTLRNGIATVSHQHLHASLQQTRQETEWSLGTSILVRCVQSHPTLFVFPRDTGDATLMPLESMSGLLLHMSFWPNGKNSLK